MNLWKGTQIYLCFLLLQVPTFSAEDQLGFKKSSRASVGSSFHEMRYLTMVRLLNSVLHPTQSHMRRRLHLRTDEKYLTSTTSE